jgi:molybdopterin-guanine dinucleotide biosynthesis protein
MKSLNFVKAFFIKMIRIERMIMIGATARQSGKTELASRIIDKFCKKGKITGVKISTLHEGDASFHGSMSLPMNEKYVIEKSTTQTKNKSTDRMLLAGAAETFWLHTKDIFLKDALNELLSMIDKNSFVVCESNSLRRIVEPDVFIMIKNLKSEIKNSVKDILELADLTIEFNGTDFSRFDMNILDIEDEKWIYKKI